MPTTLQVLWKRIADFSNRWSAVVTRADAAIAGTASYAAPIRRLHREQEPKSPFVFTSERGTPCTTAGFARMIERAAKAAKLSFKAHPHCSGMPAGTHRVLDVAVPTPEVPWYRALSLPMRRQLPVATRLRNFCGVIVILGLQRTCLRAGTERWNK